MADRRNVLVFSEKLGQLGVEYIDSDADES
jgi:hypothetical protein